MIQKLFSLCMYNVSLNSHFMVFAYRQMSPSTAFSSMKPVNSSTSRSQSNFFPYPTSRENTWSHWTTKDGDRSLLFVPIWLEPFFILTRHSTSTRGFHNKSYFIPFLYVLMYQILIIFESKSNSNKNLLGKNIFWDHLIRIG